MTRPVAIEISDFAETLQPIASEMGEAVARALVKEFGGARLYVPAVWRDGLTLNSIGQHNAQLLCKRFGPERLEIPRCAFSAAGVQRLANAMHLAGFHNSDVALALGVHYRTVTKALAGRPILTRGRKRARDERQVDLESWLQSN